MEVKKSAKSTNREVLDFGDTKVAFAHRTVKELKDAKLLFGFINKPLLNKFGSKLGAFAIKWNLPFAERITMQTVYKQFVGGRTLLEVEQAAAKLDILNVSCALDYGAEGKNDESAYNTTMTECIRALEFASRHINVPIVTTKISGLASDDLLLAISEGRALTEPEEKAYRAVSKRLDSLCYVASDKGVQLYIDAEESWIQPAIDKVVNNAMLRYNKERAVVCSTYQLYRHDRYDALVTQHDICRSRGVVLGAKLVRGAYMEKERARAIEKGYPSPINPDKATTDKEYNKAVAYCLENLDTIDFVNASHNQLSAQLMLAAMEDKGIDKQHKHALFCQLYGMSDNVTFKLAAEGYRVAKYVPYGPVADVVPYLVRRAQENTSIAGEMGRELSLVVQELERRASKTK
ncbi:MAG: proline dehydrogenase family protein [Saprospiraceae bacterium]